jgi:hypothetical protein
MPTSNWTAVVARIVAEISTITDIGQVHDRIRPVWDSDTFNAVALAQIGNENKARMWMVHLEGMDTSFADASGALKWNRQAVVEGFLQIEDASSSELNATDFVEQIIRILAADLQSTKLNGAVLSGAPPKLEKNEPRFFGFVACHYIRISMPLLTIEL